MESQTIQTHFKPVRGNAFRDLAGRQFGRLTALEPTGRKATDGCYYWLCRCSCGNYTEVSSNKLLQGKTLSCGCYGRQRLVESRTYIAGTCLEIIQSPKVPKSNTSGVKGVSRNRELWLVKISFAHKQFFLGRYRDFSKAVAVYRKAEALRAEVLEDIDTLGNSAVDVLDQRLAKLRAESRPYTAKSGNPIN